MEQFNDSIHIPKFNAFTKEGTLLFNQPTAETNLRLECYKIASTTRELDALDRHNTYLSAKELIKAGNMIYEALTDTIKTSPEEPQVKLTDDYISRNLVDFKSWLDIQNIPNREDKKGFIHLSDKDVLYIAEAWERYKLNNKSQAKTNN